MNRRLTVLAATVAFGCGGPLPKGFEDHTVPRIESIAQYHQLAVEQHGRSAGKFVITGFGTTQAATRYYDNQFYKLHDEWYWFRLLNGQPAAGREPIKGLRFTSIEEIYAWARQQPTLPLDLRWVDDGRLYSPLFYDLGLFRPPRQLGLGTLLHLTQSGARPERWAFQLEFVDVPTHQELVEFFEQLQATLPAELKEQLYWVVRSPAQEQLAQQLEAQQLRFYDRILRQRDLVVAGETEVYSTGLTAGRLRKVRSGDPLPTDSAGEILLLEDVPDYLPPAVGVVTAVPQTPLAHLNLLARNRGIPNAYRAGIMEDPVIEELSDLGAPVVVHATAQGLLIKPITEAQLRLWQQLQLKTPVAVTQVDASTLPHFYDLKTLSLRDVDTLRPAMGGKSAGYLGLLEGAPEATPDTIIGITIRPYVEHLAPHRSRVVQLLAHEAFVADARIRYLTLEGAAEYRKAHPSPAEQEFVAGFLTAHPTGDLLGDLARAGGVKEILRKAPIAAETIAVLQQLLQSKFSHYAVTQGLRFRSSSTAEDVEGFNGAGLYDSNTGFLDAAAQTEPADRKQTVEWALKKTWASYWSFEAFEERRLENIDHLSGNMGVVVHARFDDPLEKSNGVFLFSLEREKATLELNVQAGALSVTNPTSTALPEISRLTLPNGASTPQIERLRPSTVVPAGTQILTDAELVETFTRARAVATKWLENENRNRPETQKATTVVLDFEFRQVPPGWPALVSGTFPARIVLKQSRSLDPGLRGLSAEVRGLPLPYDLLNRSRLIERRVCQTDALKVTVVEAFTDPLANPDLGFVVAPFTAAVGIEFKKDIESLGRVAGEQISLSHLMLLNVVHPATASWSVTASLTPASAALQRLADFSFDAAGAFRLGTHQGSDLSCSVVVLFSTPNEYLLSLF